MALALGGRRTSESDGSPCSLFLSTDDSFVSYRRKRSHKITIQKIELDAWIYKEKKKRGKTLRIQVLQSADREALLSVHQRECEKKSKKITGLLPFVPYVFNSVSCT